ncbi:MAG: NAD(P)H-dependent oxidoreductase subunit E [Solidesulfovibrio sp.]|uniref:NADH-quinone oxidoreductase subunit NuoE family protein n=1 Tax=Solidesulfovibrio sp. TaxID=2910990 RepID=UPI002B201C9A|nr:NAD(P)H-dependent oxidoreductase subunit E [Solidesulfovibrio sp.]MEA4857669.1 NAD(P)H-dependent oxidoreductase subunit E [Solidesulfovibrio sp.]
MEPNLAAPLAETTKFRKLCGILDHYGRHPARLVPILQALQEEYRYLPEEVLSYVATSLGIPEANVFGVATFYAHFALTPKGKYIVRLCDGTACHVKHSIPILEALRDRLGVSEDKPTTPDMLFTVETVACLGACGLAPVMVINEDVYGQVTPERAVALVDAIRAKELQ